MHVPELLLSDHVAVPILVVVLTDNVADVSLITDREDVDTPETPEDENVGGVEFQVVPTPENVTVYVPVVPIIAGDTASDCAPTPAATPAHMSGSPSETNGDLGDGSIKVVSQS